MKVGVPRVEDGEYRLFFFFQAGDGIRDPLWSRGLGDLYKRQVDLPEPEGPMMEENWLFSMSKLTPLKALTSMSPKRYVFSSPLTSIMFIVIALPHTR